MLHRIHDYNHLVERWREVARKSQLRLRLLSREDGFPVFYLETPSSEGGLYISTGVHGDEAAAPEALVQWAERNAKRLASLPLLIFPCLNPWGVRNNSRVDSQGRDLNRLFHDQTHPTVAAVRRVVGKRQFSVSLTMHEDYDAQGIYLYEVQRGSRRMGEHLLNAAKHILPTDPRRRIDGRLATGGLIRRRASPGTFRKIGFPEAIWLHFHHSQYTFTFETPSEEALERRVAAQIAVIDASLKLALAERVPEHWKKFAGNITRRRVGM